MKSKKKIASKPNFPTQNYTKNWILLAFLMLESFWYKTIFYSYNNPYPGESEFRKRKQKSSSHLYVVCIKMFVVPKINDPVMCQCLWSALFYPKKKCIFFLLSFWFVKTTHAYIQFFFSFIRSTHWNLCRKGSGFS